MGEGSRNSSSGVGGESSLSSSLYGEGERNSSSAERFLFSARGGEPRTEVVE
ncbi:unnamed protein product [Meloidogyne enterolobii]|uniref:Uncharacterized protein n=1 Tax=Meloidogyne enterolobii TaxID=390850 RepID=A0ACB1A3S3_MELEN